MDFRNALFKTYYRLTKPGIIYGNLITATAGFLLASDGHVDLSLFLFTIIGTTLVIASACVFNNVIDRGIDGAMSRTKKRAIVEGTVSPRSAIVYATTLGILGFIDLIYKTNSLVFFIGVIAFLVYVVLYGVTKRKSVHGTLVGSISGAAPIVAGYCAVTDRFDLGAALLFFILAFWQMPHFYAIAMRRFRDYSAAKLPVLPVKHGMQITKIQILAYILLFTIAADFLSLYGYAGNIYLIVMTAIGIVWLWLGISGFKTKNNEAWAKKMFLFSLVTLLAFSILLSLNASLV